MTPSHRLKLLTLTLATALGLSSAKALESNSSYP